MRNCEQLLGSSGLFAYRIGSLDKLNEVLNNYGPENCRGFPRVTIQEQKGQQTEIMRQNIQVASFSGSTERTVLQNFEDIVERSLPLEKVTQYYMENPGAARNVILSYVAFFEEHIMFVSDLFDRGTYIRDYGSKKETVYLDETKELKDFLPKLEEWWKKKQNEVETAFLKLEEMSNAEEPGKKKQKRGRKFSQGFNCPLKFFCQICS
ncbi:unnamed protein product [Pocillopora meandrina]|uniref:Uncharacterized protein n=1 Tax=Pocillopora meandrina TaxID=46732 RepID=A0AAU9Y4D0_9CNID|nr:unnamed protein product [Pocillopora meandrina]